MSEPLNLDGRAFSFICEIEPERNPDGSVYSYIAYDKPAPLDKPLFPHGTGPFCELRQPTKITESGLYALTRGGEILLISQSGDLAQRFSDRNYAKIHRRNCYKGGQQTNVRINHRLYLAFSAGDRISLWFHTMSGSTKTEREQIEKHLQRMYGNPPPWNMPSLAWREDIPPNND